MDKDDPTRMAGVSRMQLGVWTMIFPMKSPTKTLKRTCAMLRSVCDAKFTVVPLVWRFVGELYRVAPGLNLLVLALGLVSSMEGVLMIYGWSKLLQTIESGSAVGHHDVRGICAAVFVRVSCTIVTSIIRWALLGVAPKLQSRVISHLEYVEMHAKLRLDVPEASDRANELGLTAHAMWNHFQFLTRTVERAFRLGSQLYFTVRQPNGATTLTLLSLASPFFSILAVSVPWKHGFVVYASNLHYLRLRALSLLVSPTYRSDVRSNNLRNWILQEYNKAQAALGAVSDVDPQTQWMSKASPLTDMLLQLSGDLPVCYWLARAVLDPHGLSLVSFAILHQHSTSVHHTVCGLFYEISRVGDSLTAIRDWYQMADTRTEVVDGEYTSYDSSPNTAGMELEFRDVSFSYPDSRSKDPAIRNVSLKIAAGSLAVVVGANGSGKSTIIKLLNRLYDADSGDILVDGVPITRYRPAELRQSQVLLSQDLQLYPLTLAENIGLGDPEAADDVSRVIDAAEAGGASGLISKLADGMATMFSPVLTAHGSQLGNNKELREILKKLERGSVLSGGEKQRVIAARAFMRLLCGKIRLVLADEPSSALDPKGELRLFQQLNVCGDGKTMVLVTHRFAHLTKHADVIICMKSGQVVEVGTHKELMAQGGEYCELYRVQAGAFSDESA